MPSRGIPHAFWLFFVFGLMAAGIIAMVGFAIEKSGNKDDNVARAGATRAIVEQLEAGEITLADLDPSDPVRIALEDEGAVVPEEEEAEAQPPAEIAPGDPDRGQQVFFQNGCNVCHGDTGQGLIGPTLAQTSFSVEQVIGQYRNPRGVMPPFSAGVVSDQQVTDVHAWLQTLPLPDTIVLGEGTP